MTDEGKNEVLVPNIDKMISAGPIFAQGTAAEHRFGVIYQGPWETLADGTCRAVRRHAVALSRAGIPVLLKSFNHTRIVDGVARHVFDYGHDPNVLEEIGTLHRTSIASALLTIKHMVIKSPEQVLTALYPHSVVGSTPHETQQWQAMVASSTVLYSVWERDCIPRDVAKVMARAGQCWVPCHQNRDALVSSGVPADKVFVVPHPYSAEEDRLAQDSLGLTKVFSPTFYSIGAWQPRKGMHELLGAFLMAFKPGEATLRLRVTEYQWKNYPSPRESVKHWLDDAIVKKNGWTITSLQGKVDIFTRNFTPQELHMFHARNRIYVSASHGEAWNLPAFDAKRYGNLVVHVSWGGTKDFCDANDVAIPFKMDPVDPSYGWGECQWAGYQMHDLIAALRTAARNPHGCVINARFSEATVGHTMLFLLQRLSAAVNTPESQRELFQGVS